MPIDVTQGASAARNQPVPASPTSQMGKDDFLKLLVAQLKHQDPTDPMDAREMITQLSQLSTVEKLTSLDANMLGMRAESAGMASMQATGLVGRTVTAEASQLVLKAGAGQARAGYRLDAAAERVVVSVRNADMQTVRTITLPAQAPGPHTFEWDGFDDAGTRLPDGMYSFEISATDKANRSVGASSRVQGRVREVSYENGSPQLIVGDAHVALGDVVSIAE